MPVFDSAHDDGVSSAKDSCQQEKLDSRLRGKDRGGTLVRSHPLALEERIACVLREQIAVLERIIHRQRWAVGVFSLIGVDLPTALDGGARTLRLFS